MTIVLKNNAKTVTTAVISSTDTTIPVFDTSAFPALGVGDYFYCTLESTSGAYEIVKVTQVNVSSFIVVRAQESTIAIPFNTGARAELRITAQSLEDQFGDAATDEAEAVVAAAIGVTVQGYDADLTAIATNSTDGLLTHTGVGTATARTITASSNGEITITNGNGVSGNPTVAITNLTGPISTAITPVIQATTVAQGAANLNTINAINIKSVTYGATGDGTTDDTAAFAAALLVGGDIFVPDGTYVISGIVLSVAGTRLFGGRGAVLKCKTGTTGTNYITLSAARCAIEGLTVNGNAAGVAYTYNRFCIKILAADCRIEGVRVYDASSMGIGGGEGAVRAIIRENEVTASGDMGIFVNDNLASVLPAFGLCANNTVIGWGSSTATASGISIRGTDWRIEGNYVEATASYANEQLGIEVWHGGDRSIVVDNVVRVLTYAEFGISLAAPHTSAVGNLVVGSTQYGIEAAATGPVQITGNTIIDPTGSGIAINISASNDDDHTSVVGNIIINCTGSGASQAGIAIAGVTSTAEGVRISGNTCTGTAVGILSTLVSNVHIAGNHVTVGASTKTGISHTGNKALIAGNTVVCQSGATHVIAILCAGSDAVVCNNFIDGSSSTQNGIVLTTGYTNVSCHNNYIKDVTSNAILSQNNVASVFIHDNKAASAIILQASNVGWGNIIIGTTAAFTSNWPLAPTASDGAALGTTALPWSDLFLAAGGVLNFNNGDVTVTHSSNTLAFGGASSGYTFDSTIAPTTTGASTPAGTLKNTADSAAVQTLVLEGDRATPTNSDAVYLSVKMSDSAGNQDEFARLTIVADNVTNTSEVSRWQWYQMVGGSLVLGMTLSQSALLPGANDGRGLGTATTSWSDLFLADGGVIGWNNSNVTLTHSSGALASTGTLTSASGTAPTAGGSTTCGIKVSSTANFGLFCGSGAPSLSAAKGSLYMRSDGSGVNDRMYVNTNGSTTWTAVVTVA